VAGLIKQITPVPRCHPEHRDEGYPGGGKIPCLKRAGGQIVTHPDRSGRIGGRREQGGIMAISGKYGKIDIPVIQADEPFFVLRAQDRLARGMVEIYKVIAEQHGASIASDLAREIARFRDWGGKRKMPD
jgi:hypothetical protein